jgi:hypothetical protein
VLFPHQIAQYLLQRGLITAHSIVDEELHVVDASRRNTNFKVYTEQGPSFLLKQSVGQNKIETLDREAAFYRLAFPPTLDSQPSTLNSDLDRYLPRFYDYDSETHVLVLELVRGAENLLQFHTRRGRFPTTLGRALGRALGTLHNQTGNSEAASMLRTPHSALHTPHWILSIHKPVHGALRELSGANLKLIKVVQQDPEYCRLLDELRDEWRADILIHRDIKWSNCIVFAPPGSGRKTRLKLVDWELSSLGDPCWDTGSVFGQYLSFWLLSVPVSGQEPPELAIPFARYPLSKMQPAMRAFWQSYVQRMGLDATAEDEWLLRSVRYSAARLLQTAYEQGQESAQINSYMVCLLQLSLNILKRPHQAATSLLGIPPRNAKRDSVVRRQSSSHE